MFFHVKFAKNVNKNRLFTVQDKEITVNSIINIEQGARLNEFITWQDFPIRTLVCSSLLHLLLYYINISVIPHADNQY